ncbi:DUF4245 domain-containing protein [Actinosynnema sp. ALI-1.44]|uniref:DUF4245 domain-containing protein n=1 Tax=Actinosynnema sp. ALI-1.44 TaxID=1933779 RepID=UPI0011784FDF|nr:DUF4245 domain-containing protein [Actinosynnema sp. ALI-1.44]
MSAPSRFKTSARDMVLSLVVLLAIIGSIVWLTQGCEFSPSGPTIDPSSAPTVDASKELGAAARRVDFPVRVPAVPDGWRANSSNTLPLGQGPTRTTAVRVGWITPGGKYLRLSQSKAPVEDLVVLEAGGGVTADTIGSADVAGMKWTKYHGRGDEPAWVLSVDGVQLLITGSGTDDDFRALATAAQTAKPITRS